LAALLREFAEVRHIQVEDGHGKPLGRCFGVKLWPNFVFLRDGHVVLQSARPSIKEIGEGLKALAGSPN
jgi:thioredoxin 1